MSEEAPSWPRRKLIRYSGVGIALAVAGCNGSDDTDDDGDGDDNEGLPDDPAEAFELAGAGSAGFREWLAPQFTIESRADGERRQLFQFNDYELISEAGMSGQEQRRDTFAEQIGVQPENIERELLLGPIEGSIPYRALFGSFDREALIERFENSDLEQTGEQGEFVIFDDLIALSGETILEHPSSAELIEGAESGHDPFEGIDEEMGLLLDLVPAGPQVTINSRDDHDDVVLDGQTILEVDGGVVTHGVRTFIFADESAATSERVRALDIDGTVRNEVLTEEINGRVAMIESEYQE